MKQTAVEWLAEQMIIHMDIRIENTTIGLNLLEQAKEMEKEQIIKARLSLDQSIHLEDALDRAEQYYNQTFKKD